MDIKQAKSYLKSLSQGIDPVTGDPLPQSDCCMKPEVAEALQLCFTNGKFKGIFPESHGAEWTKEADRELRDLYSKGLSEEEIGDALKRSKKSVHARLIRIGKVESKRSSYFAK